MTQEIEKQKVWRTMNSLPNGMGYIVWDVREVIGEVDPSISGVMDTFNGGQIYVSVSHTFTEQKALEMVFDSEFAGYEKLFVVHTKVNGLDWHSPNN